MLCKRGHSLCQCEELDRANSSTRLVQKEYVAHLVFGSPSGAFFKDHGVSKADVCAYARPVLAILCTSKCPACEEMPWRNLQIDFPSGIFELMQMGYTHRLHAMVSCADLNYGPHLLRNMRIR